LEVKRQSTFQEFSMFVRKNLILTISLLAALAGVSAIAGAADTKPIVRDTCAQPAPVNTRHGGPEGKRLMLPVRAKSPAVQCQGEVAPKPLILASFTDASGGQALVDGRNDRAFEQLTAKRYFRRSPAELTNLCVAHTVVRDWTQAQGACDEAVTRALKVRARAGNRFDANRWAADQGAGVALSNRAVMRWLSGDVVAAHNDLEQARDFLPRAGFVAQNLDAAQGQPALARVLVGGSMSR
jgi:hypothetical protein